MEQLHYNLLFRWFVGLPMDAPVWDATVFTKNRERLLAVELAQEFLRAVLSQERVKSLRSDEHFLGRRRADPGAARISDLGGTADTRTCGKAILKAIAA